MDPDLLFDYLGVRLNAEKAEDKTITINFVFSDTNQKYKLELKNSTLNHTENDQAKNADLTLTLTRRSLDNVLLKQNTIKEEIDKGDIKVQGDINKLTELLGYLDTFDFWFNIVTPNEAKDK
jgi:alkyl sulfatase BDS1-like metallo-beta-lactamase superfamily hydrolase